MEPLGQPIATLEAYLDIYSKMIPYLALGAGELPSEPSPPIQIDGSLSLQVFDFVSLRSSIISS